MILKNYLETLTFLIFTFNNNSKKYFDFPSIYIIFYGEINFNLEHDLFNTNKTWQYTPNKLISTLPSN